MTASLALAVLAFAAPATVKELPTDELEYPMARRSSRDHPDTPRPGSLRAFRGSIRTFSRVSRPGVDAVVESLGNMGINECSGRIGSRRGDSSQEWNQAPAPRRDSSMRTRMEGGSRDRSQTGNYYYAARQAERADEVTSSNSRYGHSSQYADDGDEMHRGNVRSRDRSRDHSMDNNQMRYGDSGRSSSRSSERQRTEGDSYYGVPRRSSHVPPPTTVRVRRSAREGGARVHRGQELQDSIAEENESQDSDDNAPSYGSNYPLQYGNFYPE
ncbi:hypothetical protein CBS101457_002912 [Exobasidium rhododendri]|nr:hypothetical protein CBS101457_002912 [Exobasidium rhododendri]